ncbi:GNAT family N-acetyltransferase [Agromyces albus]|uniref:GNAT family N-acetyltransferase n=1 Tax=Agromyces albus TaxID=205332 RepID=UPI00278B647B|nr:GNAT family protein [Agromyces albus]MDQ0575988.1 ribosomal-protein-alanine N-acetyltransferase [Agromyces albus]
MVRPLPLSNGLELRLLRCDDAAAIASAYTRNRTHLTPWEPLRIETFFTAEWQESEIARQLESFESGRSLPLVIADGRQIVGRVNLSGIVRGAFQSASLGYWVDARYAGQGIGTAAVRATAELGRDELGLHRIEAGTLVHNVRSQRVLLNADFEPIGLAPRYLRIAGEWQDHLMYQRILHD